MLHRSGSFLAELSRSLRIAGFLVSEREIE